MTGNTTSEAPNWRRIVMILIDAEGILKPA